MTFWLYTFLIVSSFSINVSSNRVIDGGDMIKGATAYQERIASSSRCEPDLGPLYELVSYINHHFYTPAKAECDAAVPDLGYEYLPSPGLIAKNALDCHCTATFKSPTRLYRRSTAQNPIDEHFYSLDSVEIDIYINQLGYKWEGWDGTRFYCSTIAGSCGATVPLHRYLKDGRHYFSTTMDGHGNATYAGVLCYIWPTDFLGESSQV